MVRKLYPRQISAGTEAVVVALSETEVGKMWGDPEAAAAEAANFLYANGINGLMARMLRHDEYAPTGGAVLVLERLYPLDFRTHEVELRRGLLEVFADELHELHAAGFVHGHLQRQTGFTSGAWDNILLTADGLRLIDAGRAILEEESTDDAFERAVDAEESSLQAFSEYFLSR